MDLEDWELLPNEGFNENNVSPKLQLKHNTVIDVDYFQFDLEEKFEEEVTKLPIESPLSKDVHKITKDENFSILGDKSDDQEMIPKVSFNELKENQFVDMKTEKQEKGCNFEEQTQNFDQKEEKDGNFKEENEKEDEKMVVYEEKKVKKEEDDGNWEDGKKEGVNLWNMAMTGMGALVTFGFTAVTVSLIVFSNRPKESNHSNKDQLRFQIYSHDRRFKQVVRRAKRLNEAISVMRGAPITRAHITIGGYYEGL